MTTYLDFNQIEAPGASFNGQPIVGWSRTNTSDSGRRHVGFGVYHMDVALKLGDGSRAYVTATSAGPR